MKIRTLESAVWLPQKSDEVFKFFANAANLERITPPWLRFRIVTPAPIAMRAGTRIDYRLRVHGIPLRWQSEISVWEPPFRFVDEQVCGPYRVWRHEHIFHAQDGGTLCLDSVQYSAIGGVIVDKFFVRRDLNEIFRFRGEQITRLFAEGREESAAAKTTPHTA